MKGLVILTAVLLLSGCGQQAEQQTDAVPAAADTTRATMATIFEGENHLTNVRQLTFGGQNAEAYFSYNADQLIYQASTGDMKCDQIFMMETDGSDKRMVSTGKGATTCAFISPDGESIIYASTHLGGDECPPKPDMSRGYVWALYESYDIFKADPDGSNLVRLTDAPGYDAEAVY